jgi:putative two-component system response regulator
MRISNIQSMDVKNLQARLKALVKVGVSLSSIESLDRLLSEIVDAALALTDADGASLYLRKGESLEFHISRNLTLEARLGKEAMADLFERFEIPVDENSMAGWCAKTGMILNIPNVQELPQDGVFRYNRAFDERNAYSSRSMLAAPLLDRQNEAVGVIQLWNATIDGQIVAFDEDSQDLISAFASQAGVALSNALLNEELRKSHEETLFRLSSAAEYRDKETSNHIKRMSHYSRLIAQKIGLSSDAVEMIWCSSPMHDVGKIGIPDHILHKPGLLDPVERRTMEAHAVIGAHILKDSTIPMVRQAALVALTHHEKFDGTGYPRGLKGEAIPLEGRIVALADVFDALSSRRCYKEPWPLDKVLEFLKEQKGRHFDPRLVDAFLECIPEIMVIQKQYEDSQEDFEKFSDLSSLPIPEL